MKRTCIGLSMALMMLLAGGGLRAQQCAEGNCVDGTGTMTWASGDTYTGQWKDGVMDGKGTMTWKDGRRYRGSWKNGLFDGWGALGWPSGEWYEGFFSGGKMDGTGTMRWKNGDRYTGQWKKGAMNGTGTMRYAGGKTVKGTWNNGRPVGEKPADAGNAAMAGAWRIMCKCFPGPESPYDCPSTSFVFRADGGGTFEERDNSGTVTGTIRWTLKGSALTIAQYTEKMHPRGGPRTFTYNAAGKWYVSKPAPYGPEQKIMSLCIIKKAGTR
ncbi:MAG TPA: hypothetical protein PKN50_12400 [Spirochaetota bacterium]|nr:hypothetical protein [Spirochaetota bacterium]HPV40752.1 hypothetical protein [Spirochaetota bacterium]